MITDRSGPFHQCPRHCSCRKHRCAASPILAFNACGTFTSATPSKESHSNQHFTYSVATAELLGCTQKRGAYLMTPQQAEMHQTHLCPLHTLQQDQLQLIQKPSCQLLHLHQAHCRLKLGQHAWTTPAAVPIWLHLITPPQAQ